jgi:hypothetical protein
MLAANDIVEIFQRQTKQAFSRSSRFGKDDYCGPTKTPEKIF